MSILTLAREKIGEGRYREVYREGDKALKFLKPNVIRNYGPLKIIIPTKLYTFFNFGISDFNRFEYEKYKEFENKIPEEFEHNFSKIYGIEKRGKESVSISDLTLNWDKTLSKPLSKYGLLDDEDFWKEIDRLEEMLIERDIMILDIRGENILVKETSEAKSPVLIDYKRYGGRTYRKQFIFSRPQLIKKLKRKFQRLRELHKIV